MESFNFLITLTACVLAATLMLVSCRQQTKKPDTAKLCGRWESVSGKPEVLIFKEGNLCKLTIYKRSGITREIKPETYLIVAENGNLFINTGFRIDIGYNEQTDILTFSTHGDYTRKAK